MERENGGDFNITSWIFDFESDVIGFNVFGITKRSENWYGKKWLFNLLLKFSISFSTKGQSLHLKTQTLFFVSASRRT